MIDRYTSWSEAGLADRPISRDDARLILDGRDLDLMALLAAAGRVRRRYFGNTVSVHILDNVRNGACPEDCGYCGQSKDSEAPVEPYKLKSVDEIVADAEQARDSGAYRFCMALSGRGPKDRDIEQMCEAIRRIKAMGLQTCLSAGLLDDAKARRLKEAGLDRFNHNLNTSRRHYPAICTTHTYDDRMTTIGAARQAGIGLCSGMIVGMGETHDDLLDVAFELRALRAESIPVNFLLPIEGNRVNDPRSEDRPLDPQFVLRVLCMMRLVNPTAEVRIAAGREQHLRSLQALALWPASSLFMNGYLLTEGDSAAGTLRMILDAGFIPRVDEGALPEKLQRMVDEVNGAADTADQSAGDRPTLKPTVARSGQTGRSTGTFVPSAAVGLPK